MKQDNGRTGAVFLYTGTSTLSLQELLDVRWGVHEFPPPHTTIEVCLAKIPSNSPPRLEMWSILVTHSIKFSAGLVDVDDCDVPFPLPCPNR